MAMNQSEIDTVERSDPTEQDLKVALKQVLLAETEKRPVGKTVNRYATSQAYATGLSGGVSG